MTQLKPLNVNRSMSRTGCNQSTLTALLSSRCRRSFSSEIFRSRSLKTRTVARGGGGGGGGGG